jgi:hypothetical protein
MNHFFGVALASAGGGAHALVVVLGPSTVIGVQYAKVGTDGQKNIEWNDTDNQLKATNVD